MSAAAPLEMKSAWSVRRLGELCEVIAGQSPAGSAYNNKGDGLPFYQGKKEFTDRFLAAPSVWTTQITKVAQPKDILMSVRAPVGPINETTEEICIGRGLAAIRAGKAIDQGFLWYALLWLQPRIVGNSGAVFPSINRKQIESLTVPHPSLAEQKRIVAILDQAFAALDRARDCTEANLADVVEVRDAILSSAIERATAETAEPVALGVLCKIARGGSPRPIKKFLTTDEDGINWIKISDATASGKFIDSTKERIIQEGVSKSRFVTPGSFLLTNSMSFGRPYILRTDGCIHDGWLVLEPDYDKVDQDYLYHLLGSKQIFREFDRLAAGSTVRNLNINLVSSVVVRLPPLEKQREAVELIESGVEQCAKLAEHYRLQLEDIATLRQSLLQQAFSGQLT